MKVLRVTNMKKILFIIGIIFLPSLSAAQGAGTPDQLRVLTDANNALLVKAYAQVSPISQPSLFSNTRLVTDAAGNLEIVFAGGTFSGATTISLPNLTTTPTFGLDLLNPTLSTAGVPVQMPPCLYFDGHVWNTTATAADNTNNWSICSLPVSGATPSGLLKLGSSLNGAAATFPMTLSSAGALTVNSELLPSTAITNRSLAWVTADNGFGWNATGDQLTYGLSSVDRVTFNNGAGNPLGIAVASTSSFGWSSNTNSSSTVNTQITQPSTGQVNFINPTVGFGLDFNTPAVAKFRTIAQTGYATIDVLGINSSGTPGASGTCDTVTSVNGIVTSCSSTSTLALMTAKPANQTGNATGTLKMNGLGAAAAPCTITPAVTGRVIFFISGNVTNSTILDGAQLILTFGTGTAPANAAAASGTTISATQTPAVPVAAQNQGFSIQGSTTGLTLSTAVWFDLQISNVTGGTASVSNITCSAHEM